MQAALQRHVDSSISKTINCPADISFEDFKGIYLEAYALGLKGCTTYRPNAVTGAVLSRAAEPPAEPTPATRRAEPRRRRSEPLPPSPAPAWPRLPDRQGDIVCMAKPLEREGVLAGYTYKLKWPGSDHAMYITINDIERDGRRASPFEIFINSKNLEHYAWTVALTRMISAIFRRGGDVVLRGRGAEGGVRSAGRAMDGRPLRAEPAGGHRRGHRDAHDPHRLPGAAAPGREASARTQDRGGRR